MTRRARTFHFLVWKSRCGESAPAPKFNVVCKLNDWSKAVKSQASGSLEGIPSPHKQLQFEFWTALKEFVETQSNLRSQALRRQNWLNFSLGRSGVKMTAVVSAFNSVSNNFGIPEVRVELVLQSADSANYYAELEAMKPTIEQQLGCPLTWHNPENARMRRLYERRDGDFTVQANWPELFGWLLDNLRKFDQLFRPIIADLKSCFLHLRALFPIAREFYPILPGSPEGAVFRVAVRAYAGWHFDVFSGEKTGPPAWC